MYMLGVKCYNLSTLNISLVFDNMKKCQRKKTLFRKSKYYEKHTIFLENIFFEILRSLIFLKRGSYFYRRGAIAKVARGQFNDLRQYDPYVIVSSKKWVF